LRKEERKERKETKKKRNKGNPHIIVHHTLDLPLVPELAA
jgi:hypothetical protein